MKTLCVVLNKEIIHIGAWQETLLTTDDNGDVISTPNLLPVGAVSGEFDVVRTSLDCFVLASDYASLRRNSYPSIQDQLDMQYHDRLDGGSKWLTCITAVKAAFPKPTV